jgi:hypothetical protein
LVVFTICSTSLFTDLFSLTLNPTLTSLSLNWTHFLLLCQQGFLNFRIFCFEFPYQFLLFNYGFDWCKQQEQPEAEHGGRRRKEDGVFLIHKNKRPDSLSKRRKFFREETSSPMLNEDPPFPVYISDAVRTCCILSIIFYFLQIIIYFTIFTNLMIQPFSRMSMDLSVQEYDVIKAKVKCFFISYVYVLSL